MFRHIAPYLNATDIHLLKKSYKTLLGNTISDLVITFCFLLFIKKMMSNDENEFKNRIKMKN